MIRAISSCSPSAATDRCTLRRSRACSTSAGSSCLRRQASSARSACCFPTSSTITCARTSAGSTELDASALDTAFGALMETGRAALHDEGFDSSRHHFERLLDLRYAGANSELTLAFPPPASAIPSLRWARRFGTAHVRHYGYRSDDEAIEIVNVRVIARAVDVRAAFPDRLSMSARHARRRRARRLFRPAVRARARHRSCARDDLGEWQAGPLLVEEFDSTTVVPPDGRARLESRGTRSKSSLSEAMNLLVDVPGKIASPGDADRARSVRAGARQERAGGARRRDGADDLSHGALVRRQGGARLLDGAVPRRRRSSSRRAPACRFISVPCHSPSAAM